MFRLAPKSLPIPQSAIPQVHSVPQTTGRLVQAALASSAAKIDQPGFVPQHRPEHAERLFRNVPGFWRNPEWARQADHIVQLVAHFIAQQEDLAQTFEGLAKWVAVEYKALKNRVEEHNVAQWLANLTPAERLLYETWSQGGWTDDLDMAINVDPTTQAIISVTTTNDTPISLDYLGGRSPQDNLAFLNQGIPSCEGISVFGRPLQFDPASRRVVSERDPADLSRHLLVYAMRESRVGSGIDYFGCFDFGEPRISVVELGDAGRLYVTNLDNWRNGRPSIGKFYAHYTECYPTEPLHLKSLGFKPTKIVTKSKWEELRQDCPDIYQGIKARDLPLDLPEDAPVQILSWDKPCPLRLPKPPLFKTHLIRVPSKPEIEALSSTVWVTTNPANYPAIFQHLNAIYERYQADRAKPRSAERDEQMIDEIAEIQWYYWQMMPYKRGCAATGDMMSRAMMEAAGIDPPAYREMVVPDIDAFVFSLEAYQTRLKNQMFESPVLARRSQI